MLDYKFKIQNEINIDGYINQYNNVIRFAYNRFQEKPEYKLSEVEQIVKDKMNNTDLLDSSIIKVAVNEAKAIKKPNIIFGGRLNFLKRKFNKITKDEWLKTRNVPLMLRGSSCDTKGNRKAELKIIEENSILIKLNKNTHFNIQLPKLNKKRKELLSKLQVLCENNKRAFSVKFDNEFVHIIFDENDVKTQIERKIIKDRIMSFDLNPNYIGLTVIDYKSETDKQIVLKELIDIKDINDMAQTPYQTNKRKYETMNISKYIIKQALHYQVELVCFEKLNIKSKDNNKGKKYNRLINNSWLRTPLINNIKSRCNLDNIKYQEVLPEYSSFIGQMTNPLEYDSIAAAIELSRRGYLFKKMYIEKSLKPRTLLYPVFNLNELSTHWKEMIVKKLNVKNWISLFNWYKKSKTSYRFLFDRSKHSSVNSLRLFSVKSKVLLHNFT